MGNNQLFKEIPPFGLIEKIMTCIIPDMNSYSYVFTKTDLINKDFINNIKPHLEILRKYYLDCKAKKYFLNIDEKSIITILRQILKVHEYNLTTKEKYQFGTKSLMYSLNKNNISEKKYDLLMHFD